MSTRRRVPARGFRPTLEDRLAAQRFLLAHLRRDGEPGRLPAPRPGDWACIADEAGRHRIAPLAYRRLIDGPWSPSLPDDVRERLREIHVGTALRNAMLMRETARAVNALAAANIPVILLKGIHLAGFIYEAPALRSMADIDLLVPRASLAEAERVFVDRGYGPLPRPDIAAHCAWSNHLAKLVKPGAEVIEVHYAIERPTAPFDIDCNALWTRAGEISVNGARAYALSTEDLLLHLCLHASYHHRFGRNALKALLDVSAVVERAGGRLHWDDVVATANHWRASQFIYGALALARDILGVSVPASVLSSMHHDAGDRDVVAVAARFILTPQVDLPEAVLEMKRRRTLGERAWTFARGVFLPREQLSLMYGLRAGHPLAPALYVVRLLDLLRRRGATMLRTVMRTRSVNATLVRENDRVAIEQWAERLDRDRVA